MDAGPVWASESFTIPPHARKSEVYNTAVADAALRAVHSATRSFQLLKKHQRDSLANSLSCHAEGGVDCPVPLRSHSLGPVLPQLMLNEDLLKPTTMSESGRRDTVVAAAAAVGAAEGSTGEVSGIAPEAVRPESPVLGSLGQQVINKLLYSLGVARAFQLAAQDQEYGCTLPLMKQASRR
jgi:hypothetical protein